MQAICYQKLLLKDSSSLQLLASKGYNLFLFGKTKRGKKSFPFFVLEIIEELENIASLENCPHPILLYWMQAVLGIDFTWGMLAQTGSRTPRHWDKWVGLSLSVCTDISKTLSSVCLLFEFHTSFVRASILRNGNGVGMTLSLWRLWVAWPLRLSLFSL